MRDDNYDGRRIAPVWRRIMILLAVIAAVPVVLWSITAFVRAYVAPPKVPVFRPLSVTAAAAPPASSATVPPTTATIPSPSPTITQPSVIDDSRVDNIRPPETRAPIVEARATTGDARTISSARVPLGEAAGQGIETSPPMGGAKIPDPAPPAANPEPEPAPVMAEKEAPAAPPAAEEELPPGEPIAGPVPLPPPRPHVAMAQGIPVPRPRPAAAPETASPVTPDADLTSRDYMR